MRTRGRSLFWSVAGILILTAIVGTLLQALIASAVLRPFETREARARAELALSALASAMASTTAPPRGDDLDSLLARTRGPIRPAWILVRMRDGSVVSSPPGRLRFAGQRLPAPGRDSLAGRRDPRGRIEVIAERTLVHGNTVLGEAQVIRRMWPRGGPEILTSRATLLFLPITILASVVAGLVMVRLLVRRLRAMEVFAERVAAGDLTVRIADRTGDEIGRIAEQLDHMTERLARARAELERTEAERRQLFADITHELATPLTSIRGYAETLSDPRVPVSPEERTRYMESVLEESRRMDLLIRDLFELARLEAGAAPLAKEPLDLAALSRNTVERFRPRFERAGLQVDWKSAVPEAWVRADGRRMEQVLENLLTNALRYVPDGGSVEILLDGSSSGEGRFRLTVSDNGPGIPARELPLVFNRFYRGTERGSMARDQGGSGLGLAIVREIVERHGGSVRAESRQPRGLSILIDLPRTGTGGGGTL